MKKRILFLIIFIVFISLTRISGFGITGRASSLPTNVSIFILPGASPSLSIISPENKTYLYNQSILLNYTSSNADNIWYSLDSQNNITITSSLYFNTSQGNHTLFLYANNSQGNASANVSFAANSTRFIIFYDEYKAKGNTTNFTLYPYEDLQNLSSIILENPYGKFLFNQAINITNDSTSEDNILNLDNNTNISSNRIELNATALPNFNISSTLWLYNLTFTTPRILKDGSVCPSSICTLESYSSSTGILKFNVTGFAVYSTEDTPSAPPGSGGGGGGGRAKITKGFNVDKEQIKISLKQGETKKETITIQNTGTEKIKIKISTNLQEFLTIEGETLELDAGETRVLTLDFTAGNNTKPDLYTGKLFIEAEGIKKEILVAIEVESKKPLFDVKVEIQKKFLYVMPGEEILATITLYSLGKIGRVDVNIVYIIKNMEGNTIVSEQETIAVETQASFIKAIKIPEEIKQGTHILYVVAIYDDETASASAWFSIGKKPFFTIYNITLIVLIMAMIIFLSLWYEVRSLKKYIKTHTKINEDVLIKEKLVKMKGGK